MLARWNPYQETTPLREMMNRLFEQSFVPSLGWGSQAATQPLDVYAEGDNYVIELALPGLSPDAISVSVLANQVGISGEYPAPPEGRQYLLRERASGRFERTVTLPTEVDADKAEPNYEQGLLRLVFPKAEHAKPRRISLTGGQRQQEPAATAGRSS